MNQDINEKIQFLDDDFDIDKLLDWICDQTDADQLKKETQKRLFLTEEEVDEYLQGDPEQQFLAVHFLKQFNLRDHLDQIQKYLMLDKRDPFSVSELVEACIEQQIMEELTMTREGMEITFIPHYLEMPKDQDGFQVAKAQLNRWFEQNEPDFAHMCQEVLLMEARLQLPLMWEEADGFLVALSVARYVYRAWGRMDEWEDLLENEHLQGAKLFDLMVETIENA
ncbi:MAG: hypothetical protein PUF50_02790 [Erysipelotrichaceae bacterium]|nr:hypothetical protein [Erysipelotrichaceae bacterium]